MSDLATQFARLNEEQRSSVLHPGNVAVLAGPGSGKTATLVVKVASMISDQIRPPRAVACITYNNDAVEEFRQRFEKLGLHDGPHLFLGSVHSFCLNCIVRPYGPISDPAIAKRLGVASKRVADQALEQAANQVGPAIYHGGYSATMTRLRRALACGEDVSGFDDRDMQVLARYQDLLAVLGLVDFEDMVLRSVELVTRNLWVARLLASRFPWIAVDEYQDLGGAFHKIVTTLIDSAGTRVFAVGDPDQTIYDFTGAHPRYIQNLASRNDFRSIRLRLNYRSGKNLIAASQAALSLENGAREYEPSPERDDHGEVFLLKAEDSFESHAKQALAAVQASIRVGYQLHEIAILYRQQNEILPDLRVALLKAEMPFVAEREARYPRTPFFRWLQTAAGWAVASVAEPESDFGAISRMYVALLAEAGILGGRFSELQARSGLYCFLKGTDPKKSLNAWLSEASSRLFLLDALGRSGARSNDDKELLAELLSETGEGGGLEGQSVGDFADNGRSRGKLLLTTFHSSKGRQFDVVILPGMVEGVMPPWRWNSKARQMQGPSDAALAEARRLFYVGFTRARFAVYLIHSDGYINAKGYHNAWGRSRFVDDIERRLRE